jgi:hypothetical protein
MRINFAKSPAMFATLAFGFIIVTQNLPAKDKQAVTPLEQAVIVDADGDKVGSVLGLNGPMAVVLIQFQGRLFSLNVSKNGLSPTGNPVFFTTNNCTGTPYVIVQAPGLVTLSTIAPPGNSLYGNDPNGIPQIITALSLLLPSVPGGQPASCQSTTPPPPPGVPPPSPPQILAVPALRLVDLNTVFTAPFSIRTAH